MAMSPYDLYNQNPRGGQVQVPVFDAHQAELFNNRINDTNHQGGGSPLNSEMLGKLGKGIKDYYDSKQNQGTGYSQTNLSDMNSFITPDSLQQQYGTQAPSPVGASAITPTFQSNANVQAPSSQYGFNPNMYSGMFTGGK